MKALAQGAGQWDLSAPGVKLSICLSVTGVLHIFLYLSMLLAVFYSGILISWFQ